jgi:hypothetical protein
VPESELKTLRRNKKNRKASRIDSPPRTAPIMIPRETDPALFGATSTIEIFNIVLAAIYPV